MDTETKIEMLAKAAEKKLTLEKKTRKIDTATIIGTTIIDSASTYTNMLNDHDKACSKKNADANSSSPKPFSGMNKMIKFSFKSWRNSILNVLFLLSIILCA
jgi:hypothetical protein